MSVTISQNVLNVREKLAENNQVVGLKGKQLLESQTSKESRELLGLDRKNLIINGNFNIWQRGTSHTVDAIGSVDKWIVRPDVLTGGTHITTREDFPIGQLDVPNNPKHFLRYSISPSPGYRSIRHDIENLKRFNNKDINVSVWVRSDLPIEIRIDVAVNYGSGGSPTLSSTISINRFNILADVWTKISANVNVGDILTNKIYGTSDNHTLAIQVLTTNLNLTNLDIAQAQVEFGTEATEFEERFIGEELDLCRRYVRLSDVNTRINEYSYEMRTTPTVSGALAPYLYEAEL